MSKYNDPDFEQDIDTFIVVCRIVFVCAIAYLLIGIAYVFLKTI